MKEILKEKITQGVGFWVISWVVTLIVAIINYKMLSQIVIIWIADIIFPIITLMLINKKKEIEKNEKEKNNP